VGEARDLERKKTRFFCIDRNTGEVLWEDQSFGEDWWIGIEAVTGNRMFLHGFAVPDLPAHQKIIAVELSTGEQLWENPDLSFETFVEEKILASQGAHGAKTFFFLNPASGAILEGGASRTISEATRPTLVAVDALFPEMIQEHDEARLPFRSLLASRKCTGPFEMAQVHGYTILSFCVARDEDAAARRQEIEVLKTDGYSSEFRDVINETTSVFTPESFFTQGSMLYYVKQRSILTGVHLS